ncbi:hypothetical protein PUH89_08675 [Rhodobacter capsulatus]|uniref:Uncharacterized protein n=1 Tax=Rhodobacter capsulatus TaxID=1061 RepID=A0A1G7I2M7_RHOCA|nr:hypothetical protein [Rhodobacter capsulatus]WER11025.1 hypothetical protein PUH89_08675 [Rhodobacter capsulatus]SDF06991.1 hypothetical protein SAMN04244550_01640 [Rhodobacter capsulatus]
MGTGGVGVLLSFCLVASSTCSSSASTAELDGAVARAVALGSLYAPIADRKKLAAAMLAYWEDFDKRLPRLSPVEEAWLKTEMGSEGPRLSRAVNSKEYALWSVTLRVDGCLANVRSVLRVQDSETERATEMLYWNNLTNCYSDAGDLNDQLLKAELSNGRFDGPFHIVGLNLVRSIITNTIVPSAMVDAMGWSLAKQ